MATYPGAIYAPRTKNNKSGVVYTPANLTTLYAEDVVYDDAEIVAIETELGTNPKGIYASVKANLEALWSAIGALSFSFLNLSDTPASYADSAGKVVAVNGAQTGLEFITAAGGEKCTGAEIDTGTDDAKFATSLAIRDSGLLSGAVAGELASLTAFTPLVDADIFLLESSADANVKRKTLWSNIKSVLKTYFDGLYSVLAHNHALNDLSEKSYNSLADKPTIPVKATGAEINTGTDDAKFATPKAIADSDIAMLADIPNLVNSKFFLQTFFESIDSWVQSKTATSTFILSLGLLRMNSIGAADSFIRLTQEPGITTNVVNFAKNFETIFRARMASTTSQNVRLGVGQWDNLGLFFEIQDGTLYAVVVYFDWELEAVAYVRTQITGITLNVMRKYKIVYTAVTEVKFYVDDVLKVTEDLTTYFGDQDLESNTVVFYLRLQNTSVTARTIYFQYLSHSQTL